jgi:hypothetical protein
MAASVIATIFHFRDTSGGGFSIADAVCTTLTVGVGVGVTGWRSLRAGMPLFEMLGIVDPGTPSIVLGVGSVDVANLVLSVDRVVEV